MKTKTIVTDITPDRQKTERLNTFKEAVRKVAVVGAALAATASVSGCVPFYGQVGMVGGYTDGQIVYSETNPYSYSNGWSYNYGGVLPYYNSGIIPGYGYSYEYTVPNYGYTIPDYDYGGGIFDYGYRAPDYDYNRGYGDMPDRDYGDRDGGRIWMGHRR